MHYGIYEGGAISIVQAGASHLGGARVTTVLREGAKPTDKQYARRTPKITHIHNAVDPCQRSRRVHEAGKVVSMVTDMPGRMAFRFAVREVCGASGFAWAAATAGPLLVPMTHASMDRGWAIRVHPALEAHDFDSP